ncbi:glutathionylspermidine synthase family protein [Fuchsiella alkaliacetigena]|uniref:glutathionylspermidine synthase family protein n=1 Tax=Fuchsiella alkaliacetigena TaxID=957042 RepID=UPI00200B46E3|nr:glutathionylspermidine synthase family protein [Fuchsiella alkaliacetigena]MCK8823734.1 glutathionylspermidine synthase family protein [Fuchsiella alkaliacetigena]
MLAKLNQQYQRLLATKPSLYAEDLTKIYQDLEEQEIYYQGQVIPILYQPFFFSSAEIKQFTELGSRLSSILVKVIERYLEKPEFRSYFAFSPQLEELILVDPGYSALAPMLRADIFYYGLDDFKLCELNTDGSSGMVKSNVLEKLFLQSAAVEDLNEEFGYSFAYNELIQSWIDTLLKAYSEFDPHNTQPNIAIMDFDNLGMVSEFKYFQQALREAGYQSVIVDPRELEYRNDALYYQDLKIDLIYRRAVTPDLMERYSELDDLLAAYRQQAVCLVGSFRSHIIHNKVLFALLHDRQKTDFLSAADREFIEQHVPKTELLSDKRVTRKQLLNRQEELVLKPLDLYGAEGVYIGADLRKAEWRKIIDEIDFDDYLVQEFCPLPELELAVLDGKSLELQSYKYILGLFIYDFSFQGIYTRAGQQNVIASSTGCVTLPNLISY